LNISDDYIQIGRRVKAKFDRHDQLDLSDQLDYNSPMIELIIPGRGPLRLQHLVTDVNGTLAVDGVLIDGLAKRIASLRDRLEIHMLTADTHGRQALIDEQLKLKATRVQPGNEPEQKAEFVRKLGAGTVVAIGQGANDAKMLEAAALGICVLSQEGVATETLISADIVVPNISAALDLLDKPIRIIASLRK
jgi:soluble P-type ATPase